MASDTLSSAHKVMTFDSGARLFAALEKHIPDLILLDIEMPEMDGYKVLQQLKGDSRFEEIPVIFLTALTSAETELKGLSLGAVDYISKPFSAPLLRRRVYIHLELKAYKNSLEEMVAEKIQETYEKNKKLVSLKNAIIKTTAEIVECRDGTTGGHIERTQTYLRILINAAKKQGLYLEELEEYDLELVLQASQLHDVGKIYTPDAILLKPDKLDAKEFEEVKKHTRYGEDIIAKMKENTGEHDYLEYARIFASSHHEKWDGSGYPLGLKGKDIPLLGRLMAVADVYDALVSWRPYKKPYTHERAMEIIMSGSGQHFDPELIKVLTLIHEDFKLVSAFVAAGASKKIIDKDKILDQLKETAK